MKMMRVLQGVIGFIFGAATMMFGLAAAMKG